jgi:hypothetical protein
MNATLFPTRFQQQPVRLASPMGWVPARRALPSEIGSRQLGQQNPDISAIAKGADITLSVLTGGAAMVSGIALMTLVGAPSKTDADAKREGYYVPGGKPASRTWNWVGGIIAVVGLINIFSSLSRASGTSITQAVTATITQPTPQPATR